MFLSLQRASKYWLIALKSNEKVEKEEQVIKEVFKKKKEIS